MGLWTGWNGMDISATGLTAQRLRMDVIANNIANADTTRTPQGGPYRREMVQLSPMYAPASFSDYMNQFQQAGSGMPSSGVQTGAGVQVDGIVQDSSPFTLVYDPTNPDAVNGYVQMPNVDIAVEMTDLVTATRAYEANVTAFDAAKQMAVSALALGK